jgi:hypothetical protein
MLGIINFHAHNKISWTKYLGNAVVGRETIQPEGAVIYKVGKDAIWKLLERERVVNTAAPFFNCTNVPFDFRHVLVRRNAVELNLHESKISSDGFKLTVHKHMVKSKASFHVESLDLSNHRENRLVWLVGKKFGRSKFDISRDCHKEWELIDKHNISAQDNVSVMSHNRQRDVHGANGDTLGVSPYRFALEDFNVGTNIFFSNLNVSGSDRTIF